MPRDTTDARKKNQQAKSDTDTAHETNEIDFDVEHDQERAERRSRMHMSRHKENLSSESSSLAPLPKTPFEQGRAPVSEDPVPAPFDMPIPIGKCGPPPPPRDWSSTPAILGTPTEPLTGQPVYKAEYADEEHAKYKQAFNASWSEAQSDYKELLSLHRGVQSKQNELSPFLGGHANIAVGGHKQNATNAFKGDRLKGNLSNIDAQRVSPDLAHLVAAAKDKADDSDSMIASQKDAIKNANSRLHQVALEIENSISDIDLAHIEGQMADLNLDKDKVRRDLDDAKAKIKAAVETAKAIFSFVNILTDPTKIAGNTVAALSQTAVATGAGAEASMTVQANQKLDAIDGQIQVLQGEKFRQLFKKAENSLSKNLEEMRIRGREINKAMRDLQAAKRAQGGAYRQLAETMTQVGGASGMNKIEQGQLAAAVEAVPRIDTLIEQLEGMESRLGPPEYTEASGIGAAMSSNAGSFTHAIGMLKGNKQYIAEQRAIWEGRKASVKAAIDQALFVPGTEI